MKIGIGVTTMGIRPIKDASYKSGCRPDTDDVYLVHTDHGRLGPAAAKNETMRKLYDMGCTHMFLFDDDCYPVMGGWAQYVTENAAHHGLQYVGLPEAFKSRPASLQLQGELLFWDGMLGCFLFQTREMMDTVGYYNRNYVRYGFEDSGRNDRMRRAMGYASGNHPSLLRLPSYIHSEDVFGEDPEPNLSREEKEKFIAVNRPEWTREVTSDQLYYPYR